MSNVWENDDYYNINSYRLNHPIIEKKFVHPISQPDTIHSYLRQTRIWVDHEGVEHKIKDMSKEYIWNVLSWLNTNKARIEFTYYFSVDSDGMGLPLEAPLVKKLERRYLKLSGINSGAISSTA